MMYFKRLKKKGEIHKNSNYNNLSNDIRMKKVSLNEALDFLQNLNHQWVYIKYINHYFNDDGKGMHEASIYTKLNIREIIKEEEFIELRCLEDDDKLCIYFDKIIQTEKTDICDEIKIVLKEKNVFVEILIKKYQPNAQNRYNEILKTDKHIIVTEGKTDWKILKKALSYFQKKGRYTKLDINFFEFESDMGGDTADKICEYNALFANNKMRIFLFDSDVKKINEKHKNFKFKAHGNNVYSFILPIPDFRKNTPFISIENYFSDDDIKTEDESGRRLYLVSEFDIETGKHKFVEGIYSPIGKDKQPNHILDQKVFKIEEEIHAKSEIMKSKTKKNIALTKSDFANNIYNEIGNFKNISLQTFSLVFDVIEEIFEDYHARKYNSIEISEGVYLEKNKENFEVLSIYYRMPHEKAILMPICSFMSNSILFEGGKLILVIKCIDIKLDFLIPITITKELIEFLENKIQNNFNRIELHIMDESTQKYISHKELFAKEENEVIFTKILSEIKLL